MKIIGWFLGVSFAVFAAPMFFVNFWWVLLALSGAIICLPPFQSWANKKQTKKEKPNVSSGKFVLTGTIFFVVGFVVSVINIPIKEQIQTAQVKEQSTQPLKEISLSVGHKFISEKLVISGKTNLPIGTKIGISLSKNNNGIGAQDFDIFVREDHTFENEGYTNEGKKIYGKHSLEIVVYNNKHWQTLEIQKQLNGYAMEESTGIVAGQEFIHKVALDFGHTKEELRESKEIASRMDDFTSNVQPALALEAEALWLRLQEIRENPEFHFFGFARNVGREWLNRQEALVTKIEVATEGLSVREKFKYDTFIAVAYMRNVGLDWLRNEGKTPTRSENQVNAIKGSIARKGIAADPQAE